MKPVIVTPTLFNPKKVLADSDIKDYSDQK